MPKLPNPPPVSRLRELGPDLHTLPAQTELWRVYFRGSEHSASWSTFRIFGPNANARFDHHLPPPSAQQRGILYAATHVATCLAEVFQKTRVIDTVHREPWLVGFATAAPVSLLDLTGAWPTVAGASMAINSGPRPRARLWSRAIYDAYPQVDGLWYASSMNANRPAVALYERAQRALPPEPTVHRALADPLLQVSLRNVAADLGYSLNLA